jgi:phytoene synthase
MKLVPEPKRSAMYALYAWMREADDLADTAGDGETKREALERFRKNTDAMIDTDPAPDAVTDAAEGPTIWPAVRQMARGSGVPRRYFHEMIEGQLLDQEKHRYPTFDALYGYCYRVASVVGLACIEIWGYEGDAETRQLAEWRGIAFQLTNILRDVLEDARRDRVYLPAEDFDLHELSPTLFTMSAGEDAVAGLRRTAERAADYYERSAPLEKRVHPDGRPCLWAMTQIYRGLLIKIRRDPAAVLRDQRIRLGSLHKGWIALRASWRRGLRA